MHSRTEIPILCRSSSSKPNTSASRRTVCSAWSTLSRFDSSTCSRVCPRAPSGSAINSYGWPDFRAGKANRYSRIVLREKSSARKLLRKKSEVRRQKTECRHTLPALCIALMLASVPLHGQQKQLNLDSFETVWTTIRDQHWEKNPGGLDWQAIRSEERRV